MAETAELVRNNQEIDFNTRRYNDTVTWLAEVLPGSMRTPFEYSFDGKELYASDGSAMGEIFDEAIEQAKSLPAYEQRRRQIEKGEYSDMIAMMRGDLPNTMIVVSDFPPELMNATEDVGGYNVSRKQTMLRVFTKNQNGTLSMYSQSLDGSNRQALEEIIYEMGYGPAEGELLGHRMHDELSEAEQKTLTDKLLGIYDRSLTKQFGGDWYAGMQGVRRKNTFDFVCEQQDLVQSYLATTEWFTGGDADYNLAAAIKARYIENPSETRNFIVNAPVFGYEGMPIAAHAMAMAEMHIAGGNARRSGENFSGCGATIKSGENSDDNMNLENLTALEQLEMAGLGNQADKSSPKSDKFGPLKFKCPRGHDNERPPAKSPKDFLTNCKKCGTSLKC